MADIFISYKREERARILPLAQALERDGYTVWWDLDLVTGERWAARIKTELDAAKAVIVMWTASSVTAERTYASEWIENEANEATRQNKLAPVLLDDGRIPWTHQQKQYADLVGWRGDAAHAGYQRLLEGVERLAGKRSAPASPEVEAWIAAERAQSAEAYRDFLAQFPYSRFSVLAKARALELDEAAAWSTLGGAPSERELKVFLQEYPDGRFAEEAKKSLAKLKPPKLKLSARQIAAWIGVPTAALTLLITVATFRDTFFPPRADGAPVEEPIEIGAVAANTAAPLKEPVADAPPAAIDARTAPSSVRAPLVRAPASLPDFALFRECEGCPEMVVIPGGSFLMGSPAGEAGRDEDEDSVAGAGGGQIRVSVRRFAIARFETTWEEWEACVDAGVCGQGPVDKAGGDNGWGRGRRPVIEVDWNDAGVFARWVNGRASVSAYRRPTEAEWEYAARAGTTTRWSFGDDESQLGAHAWFFSNSNSRTQPVGGKTANRFGLHDVHGNVWEWVEDCYAASYSGLATNGSANTTQSCSDRVGRGGSWNYIAQYLRSAIRYWDSPTSRDNVIGFRLARTL